MKYVTLGSLLVLSSSLALAGPAGGTYDYAQVTRVQPVYERVAQHHPVEQCWSERVAVHQSRNSATAPLLGAVLGGALGNELGSRKSNKKVGAVVGAALGASIANDISRNRRPAPGYQMVQRCQVVDQVQWRDEVVGYDVSYRYHGTVYHTRLPYDPGKNLRVSVNVSPVI